MTITYTWEVTGLKTTSTGGLTDAVVQTYWKKTGTDENGNEGTFSGATPFTVSNTPAGTFIPFEELTQETILGWIKSVVVGNYEQHVNSKIAEQIAKNITPVVDNRLPWMPVVEAEPVPAPV